MIPQYSIQEWHEQVPWNTDAFLTDVEPLLRPDVAFNPQEAYQFLFDKVIEKMIVPAT